MKTEMQRVVGNGHGEVLELASLRCAMPLQYLQLQSFQESTPEKHKSKKLNSAEKVRKLQRFLTPNLP
jgi:hypothetical protein